MRRVPQTQEPVIYESKPLYRAGREPSFTAMWHACTLHGTQPDAADNERLSLRYLFARRPGVRAGLDAVNASLRGPIRLGDTRADLDENGAARIKANTVNRA